ncbi:MAG: Multifunctional alkaline phosphatase superfamily protein [Phycisphaerae bacterium]|nr:Multifunctional alkaline phosphatase superfamily protein [Phycisphaerae bacterium]
MSRRPHIVIFNPDQWRGDVLGHMGNPAAVTPTLDALAADEAVSFANAFCQNPVCTPSRCSFMTGWYPHTAGHRTMSHMLRPHEPVLLKQLKDAGWFVWWGGKNDLVPGQNPLTPYCDVRYKPDRPISRCLYERTQALRGAPDSSAYYSFYAGLLDTAPEGTHQDHDTAYVCGAIDLINRYDGDRPLCIYLPLGYPHPPYGVAEPFYSITNRAKIPDRLPTPTGWAGKPSLLAGIHARQHVTGWSDQQWRELRGTYYGMCSRQDHLLGRLIDALKRRGLWDDTALFVFSDHGDFTGDYGLVEKTQNTFEDVLTRVPLIVKPPAGVACRPGVRDALVELVDFSATVYDLGGLTPGYTHFGRSLLPVIAGDAGEHRDAVFCEGGRLDGETHCMEHESTSASDPAGLYWPRVNLQTRIPEHTKAVMCRTARYKYVRRLYESDELYDLQADPGELVNRIDDPAMAGELGRLKERMLTFFMETGDVVPHDPDER